MAPFTIHLAPLGGPRVHSFLISWKKYCGFFSRFQQINLTEIPKRSRCLSPFWPSLEAILLTILPTLQFSRYLKKAFFSNAMLVFWRKFYPFNFHGTRSINSIDPGRSSQSSLQSRLSRREALRPVEEGSRNVSLQSINKRRGPYQRTPKEVARAIRFSGLGVRSVGPVGDFLDPRTLQYTPTAIPGNRQL